MLQLKLIPFRKLGVVKKPLLIKAPLILLWLLSSACNQGISQVVNIDTKIQTQLLSELIAALATPKPTATPTSAPTFESAVSYPSSLPIPIVRPEPTPTQSPTPVAIVYPRPETRNIYDKIPEIILPTPTPKPKLPQSVHFEIEGTLVKETYSSSLYLKITPYFRDESDQALDWGDYMIFFDLRTRNGDNLGYCVHISRAPKSFIQPTSIYMQPTYQNQEIVATNLKVVIMDKAVTLTEIKEGLVSTGYYMPTYITPSPTPTPKPSPTPSPTPTATPTPAESPSPHENT